MRVYNSPLRVLVLLAVVLFLSGATMKGSHFMWVELLKADPKILVEAPWLRHLVTDTYLPQFVLSLILLGAWVFGSWWSKSQGVRFVPTLFLSKVDKAIAAFGTRGFEAEFRALMRHRCGRKGASDLDLLVRTVLDDVERRRNLFFSLERSRIPVAKRYLLMRMNEAAFWSLLLWLVFFFYGHLLIPFLVFPAGRWIPGALAFIQNSNVVKILVAIASFAATGHKVITWAQSIALARSTVKGPLP